MWSEAQDFLFPTSTQMACQPRGPLGPRGQQPAPTSQPAPSSGVWKPLSPARDFLWAQQMCDETLRFPVSILLLGKHLAGAFMFVGYSQFTLLCYTVELFVSYMHDVVWTRACVCVCGFTYFIE